MSTRYKTTLWILCVALLSVSTIWAQSYTRGNLGKPISNTIPTTYDTLSIPPGTTIGDINVRIDTLFHTWDGDLDMFLISPAGDTIELSTDNGGSGDDFIGTVFDQEASTPITAGSAPFTGSFIPEGDLSILYGMDAGGDWILMITDDAGGDDGTLEQWGIDITPAGGGPNCAYNVAYVENGGNPGGLNTDADFANTALWDTLENGSNSANFWSRVGAIPFPFEFCGVPVSHFRVSQNGLVTFDTTVTGTPPNENQPLPTDSLPPLTIACFWDAFTANPPTGSNDRILTRLFVDSTGAQPSQFWIKWYSFEYGNPNTSFEYMSVVLEEGTNNIYIVDMYGSSSGSPNMTTTVGIQADPANAIMAAGPNQPLAGNGSSNADNDYYAFTTILPHDYAVNWVAPETNLMIAGNTYMVEAEVANLGANAEVDVPVTLAENGMPLADILVSLAPGEVDTVVYSYTPASDGAFELSVTANLTGDGNPANDSAADSVRVFPAGSQLQTVFVQSDTVNKPISNSLPPTIDTLTITLSADQVPEVVDVEVIIDSLTHTWDSDLDIFLVAPNLDTIELSTDNGGSGDNYIGTVFDDQASTPITAGSAPFTGIFQPEEPLANLNGSDPNGMWQLYIIDDFAGDDGTLHQWSLNVTVLSPPSGGPGVLFEEVFSDTVPPAGWQVLDNDGGGGTWTFVQQLDFGGGQIVNPESGVSFWWNRYLNSNGFLIDDWIISPQIPAATFDSLVFYAGAVGGSFPDSLKVLISTTGTNPGDFTEIAYFEVPGPIGSWHRFSFDISAFSGNDIYVAVNHYHQDGGPSGNASDNVWVDHFIVTGDTTPPPPLNPPRNLQAMAGDQEIELWWDPPAPPGGVQDTISIAYHDGGFESQLGCSAQGVCELAVRFTPPSYPVQLLWVEFSQQNNPTSTVEMRVYLDPAGAVAGPTPPPVHSVAGLGGANGTFVQDVSGAGILVGSGDFYVGCLEENGFMGLANDLTNQNAFIDRNWASLDGGATWDDLFTVVGGNPALYGNLGITAFVLTNANMVMRLYPDGTAEEIGPADEVLGGKGFDMTAYKNYLAKAQKSGAATQGVHFSDTPTGRQTSGPVGGQVSKRLHEGEGGNSGGVTGTTGTILEGVLGYNIYRSEAGGAFQLIASVDSTNLHYLDTGLTNGTEYCYYVTALYPEGESPPSDTACATPTAPPIVCNEALAEHNTPEYRTAITNEGTIGMLNVFGGLPGWEWPLGANQLFEGAIMIGVPPDQVSDAARVIDAGGFQNQLDQDFRCVLNIDTLAFNADSTVYHTAFDDSNHANSPQAGDGPNAPLPVEVEQWSYSYNDPANSGYLILCLAVTNTGPNTLNNLLIGMYHDWDINNYITNTGEVRFISHTNPNVGGGQPFDLEIAYVWDNNNPMPYLGAVPLSQTAFRASRIADNAQEIFPGGQSPFTEANKYDYMLNRRANDPFGDPFGPNDKSLVVGVGGGVDGQPPADGFTLNPGETAMVGFAIVGGNDITDFEDNARAALDKWIELGYSTIVTPLVGLDGGTAAIPTEFALEQNYPNPFNPTTTIRYALKENAQVTLKIYNVLGQVVKTLVNEKQTAGFKTVQWDGTDDRGVKVASGIYVYRLEANDFVDTKKMILLK